MFNVKIKLKLCYCLGDVRLDDVKDPCPGQRYLCIFAYHHPSNKKDCYDFKNDFCGETHKLRPMKSIICALNQTTNNTFTFQTQCEAMAYYYTKNTSLTYFTEILGDNKTCDLQPLDFNTSNEIFEI